ncbi:hypothetical protein GCM10023317_31860 [Actinopolymorpha pittospori]
MLTWVTMIRVLSPADVRERLRTAATAAFEGDVAALELAESWLTSVSARDLLRIDGFARQYRCEGPTLGTSQQWTRQVLSGSLPAAALASMHPDGFVRERAVRLLDRSRTPLSERMLALRAADHVAQVRVPAIEAVLSRTDLKAASRIMPVLQRFEARGRGAEARTLYLGAIENRHGEPHVWAQMRESTDRDLRRAAFQHSRKRGGLLRTQDAVDQLPRERDQVVRRLLANLIADNAEPAVIRAVLLPARTAESRVLGLVKLDASQLTPSDVEALLVDSSVLVRSWARQRWTEMGNDPVATCRQLARFPANPTRRARAYLALAEAGAQTDRGEVLHLVHSTEPALQKVGLRLLVDKATSEDVPDLLGLVAAKHSRIARMASEVLAHNVGLWSIADLAPLKRATNPHLRRRGWWLHRSRLGWEPLIADLEVLRDPDRQLAVLGRQPTPPMYRPPDERQQQYIAELLIDAPLSRDQKLAIALAAGLRDLMTELQASRSSCSIVVTGEG